MDRASSIKWDEVNLAANEEEKESAQRTKIAEPKTPFHYLGDDGEPEPWPPKAAAAVPVTPQPSSSDLLGGSKSANPEASQYHENTLQVGMHDLGALAAHAMERREKAEQGEDDSSESEEEKRRKFEAHRKAHYQTGSLAELRAKMTDMEENDGE
ncbi:hypothetical protein AB1Y20_019333 [Prymnesium parvum]|uniref:Protein phosphatase inhibitor 2 n=1 Tax=Prymnesium parvum TaxID=97485 RepID=A0AB34JU71_PRYPA|mmetsp:Transcript_29718/g.74321  ORF Transcript_29718/g.74321 Transcript_29718/m.74321 type:complete len:155 (+) Transcript_29718:34-498(+)